MEIIFEILFEFLFEFFGEFILQTVGEILFEVGFYSILETRKNRKERSSAAATTGYMIVGATLGGLSLLVFPESLIPAHLRILNLIFTPILAGIAMAILGWLRQKRGQELIRLDKFMYGFIFAFSMALVRYFGTM